MSETDAGSEARAIVALLVNTGRATLHQFNRAVATTGLRMRQIAALRELEGGPSTQQGLADALPMDPTKLVGLLNELESADLIQRRRDPRDRRRHIVAITEEGSRRLADAMRVVEDFEESVIAGLTPNRRTRLRAELGIIAATVQTDATCGADDQDSAPGGST